MTVPASVREIGTDAFCGCEKLKRVTFAENSRLEKLGVGCFAYSAIETITVPRGVKELQRNVLTNCERLKEVMFGDCS